MPTRYYKPKGTRVSLHIPPDLATEITRSPRVVGRLRQIELAIDALADSTVPVDTGHLKESRLSEVSITPQGAQLLIGYTAFYAHMVHNGTVKLTANPWLLNAALSVLVTGRAARAA